MSLRSSNGTAGPSYIKYATRDITFPPLTVLFSIKRNTAYVGAINNRTYTVVYFSNATNGLIIYFDGGYANYQPLSVYSGAAGWGGSNAISFQWNNSSFNPSNGNAPYLGEWYDLAFVISGTATSCQAYGWIGKTGTMDWYQSPVTINTLNLVAAQSFDVSILSSDAAGGALDVNMDNVKIWTAALTSDELQAERQQKRLARSKDIAVWLPMVDTNATAAAVDYATGKLFSAQSTAPVIDNGSPTGWGAAPYRLYDANYYRALIMNGGKITTLPQGQEGTGKKPLVYYGGTIKERSNTEGIPLILKGANLYTINSSVENITI